MQALPRERTFAREHQFLSPYATFADKSRGRLHEEAQCDVRTPFQRDRDRILHCDSFRRLKHKTQVFLSPVGDHYRTRLTHTLEVSQIARTVAYALDLNESLTEAIAMGHDLGHTPFGHAGERALNAVCPLGFEHFTQSLRVVDVLEKDGKGLNLTHEVRDGILRHTKDALPQTREGQIVRISDKIAYINHDIEDAIHAGVLCEADLPRETHEKLGTTKSQRITTLVTALIENGAETIAMSPQMQAQFELLHEFMFAHVYTNPVCKSEETKAIAMVEALYAHFMKEPGQMPPRYQEIAAEEGEARAACDYIAGMTDRYAVRTFEEIFVPKSWIY